MSISRGVAKYLMLHVYFEILYSSFKNETDFKGKICQKHIK